MERIERETLRYLGYGGAAAGERVLQSIRAVFAELEPRVRPKSAYGLWDCQVRASTVELAGLTVHSRDLAEHIKGCRHAALLACTLGAACDTLLRQYGVLDMEKAVVAHAVCAAMLEAYCDRQGEALADSPELLGWHPHPRFSPGYGDFDIACQKDILRLLDGGKRIGLTLTEGYMLIPAKSVTAVIGFSAEKSCAAEKCAGCGDRSCAFRRETP